MGDLSAWVSKGMITDWEATLRRGQHLLRIAKNRCLTPRRPRLNEKGQHPSRDAGPCWSRALTYGQLKLPAGC